MHAKIMMRMTRFKKKALSLLSFHTIKDIDGGSQSGCKIHHLKSSAENV